MTMDRGRQLGEFEGPDTVASSAAVGPVLGTAARGQGHTSVHSWSDTAPAAAAARARRLVACNADWGKHMRAYTSAPDTTNAN